MRQFTGLVAAALLAHAQGTENPFRHLMEYAQPRPETEQSLPLLPFQPLSPSPRVSLFPNVNLIVPEADPTPIQNESSIAINPRNPRNLIASAVDYRANSSTWVYVSSDGGYTWSNRNLGKPFPDWVSSNDPSVTFDADGYGYLCYGGFNLTTGENGVFIARTTDGGQSWQAHIPVILHRGTMTPDSAFEDKYYITADHSGSSPYRGRLYIPWKRVIPRDSSTQIVLSFSQDRGLTWSTPVPVSDRLPFSSEDTTYGQSFPLAATGPDGTVYVVWNHGPQKALGFARSTTGGASFEPPRLILRYRPLGTAKAIPEGVRHTLKGGVRAETYPVLVCDTTQGSRRGWLYLCWAADPVPNIYFSRSTDGGQTWSEPVIVHSDTAGDQFWPWMALDPTTGDLAIMYLDSRDDPGNVLTTVSVSYSSDGGTTWTDRRIGDTLWDLRRNPFRGNAFAGDYSGCAFFAGRVYPSWVDMRNTTINLADNDVYTAPLNVRAPLPVEKFRVHLLPDTPTALRLSWEAPTQRVFGQPLTAFEYVLLRNGSFYRTLPGSLTSFLDTALQPHELYRYSIAVVSGNDTSLFRSDSARAGGARQPAAPELLPAALVQPDSVRLSFRLPTRRADGTTPLRNLSALRLYRDSALIATFPVSPADTGTTLTVTDVVSEAGFYRYFATALAGAEESPPSAWQIVYAGRVLRELFEPFAAPELPRYYNSGAWGLTAVFAFSPPLSLTESPQGPYANRERDTLVLFPIAVPAGDSALELSFVHAAIVHPSDTGFVEIAWNTWDSWQQLGAYNASLYAPWGDGVLDDGDWRLERFLLPRPDTARLLWVRFRFFSGPIRTDEGWFLDDIRIQTITTVPGAVLEEPRLFPNPARTIVRCRIPNAERASFRLWNALGQSCPVPLLQRSSAEVLLDLRSFPAGVYAVQALFPDGHSLIAPLLILR
ncbi:hypothetical protein HRbin21_00890 [bacterium HR21]|nr:hypothetical protein HRbin21_00890 [bacterium HR21]